MSDTVLRKKLLVKESATLLAIEVPQSILSRIAPCDRVPAGEYNVVLACCTTIAELNRLWRIARKSLKTGGALWIAYPKLSGKLKSDITRDKGWELVSADDWLGVTQISIDDTWSALRFKPRADIKVLTRKVDFPGKAQSVTKK
jgi:hypothetical protein